MVGQVIRMAIQKISETTQGAAQSKEKNAGSFFKFVSRHPKIRKYAIVFSSIAVLASGAAGCSDYQINERNGSDASDSLMRLLESERNNCNDQKKRITTGFTIGIDSLKRENESLKNEISLRNSVMKDVEVTRNNFVATLNFSLVDYARIEGDHPVLFPYSEKPKLTNIYEATKPIVLSDLSVVGLVDLRSYGTVERTWRSDLNVFIQNSANVEVIDIFRAEGKPSIKISVTANNNPLNTTFLVLSMNQLKTVQVDYNTPRIGVELVSISPRFSKGKSSINQQPSPPGSSQEEVILRLKKENQRKMLEEKKRNDRRGSNN